MSWLSFCCTKSSNRGWVAWIPAVALLATIAFQLYERVGEAESSGADAALESGDRHMQGAQ